ncbi:hypothetical protein NMY22_g18793 [Coprinellus aureogranulatus]|nr:hypothetical protein NMY22_g18793 [Coprinellus aureogranulatus]
MRVHNIGEELNLRGLTGHEAWRELQTGDADWSVDSKDAWALVGKGKGHIFQTLLGHTRIHPTPPDSLYPTFKSLNLDPFSRLKFVSFRHSGGGTGDFYDYTARYGAMRDGDDKTLGQTFDAILQEESIQREERGEKAVDEREYRGLIEGLGLTPLLGVPLVALSNGQMRRARIVRAILRRPDILLLDEPLTGLDIESRNRLIHLLQSFKTSPTYSPNVLSSYRLQEIVDHLHGGLKDVAPSFVSHIAFLENETFWAGSRDEFFGDFVQRYFHGQNGQAWANGFKEEAKKSEEKEEQPPAKEAPLVADLQGINVVYQGTRQVTFSPFFTSILNQVSWQIRQGERWHLQGQNGSGKTTLLSLITGDHPQSYTQKHLLLPPSYSPLSPSSSTSSPTSLPATLNHRKRIPTPTLKSTIGIVSPELFDAFPRREPGMSVWDAVQTGFGGVFVPANKGLGKVKVDDILEEGNQDTVREWRVKRCWEVLEALGPEAWSTGTASVRSNESGEGKGPSDATQAFASRPITSLTQGEQRVVLLMRALVGRPPLVILDEVWSGMDEGMVNAVKRYFKSGNAFGKHQAVVVVTHWEEEVPWTREEGLKRFRIEKGHGRVVEG